MFLVKHRIVQMQQLNLAVWKFFFPKLKIRFKGKIFRMWRLLKNYNGTVSHYINPLCLLHQYTSGTFIFPHTISLVYWGGEYAQMAEGKFKLRSSGLKEEFRKYFDKWKTCRSKCWMQRALFSRKLMFPLNFSPITCQIPCTWVH